jgi:hypothetical protein
MVMPDSPLTLPQSLTRSQIAALRWAASTMTGAKRRAFEAAMTLQYCAGTPLQAETTFGWSRRTVALGVAARRPGSLCRGAHSAFSGRKRWEDLHPQVAEALRSLAEAHAPHAPMFRTNLASTRLTVPAALAALRSPGYREEPWPSPSTMAEVLHRLGFRLRNVVKAQPQKQSKETDAIVDTMDKKTRKRRPRTPSHACALMVKRPSTAARSRVVASRGALRRRAITIGACRRKTCRVGASRKIPGSGASPWAGPTRRVTSSSMRLRPGGRRWRQRSR